jgi:hypothetical protein
MVTDRLKSPPGAIREMKQGSKPWRFTRHLRGRLLNDRVEQELDLPRKSGEALSL